MRSASMGTGDYFCITVRGGAPWGFSLRQGNELHHPLIVCQVDSRGRGALAGLCDGDEVVSLNGEPCADLTLPESLDLMEASNSLQLLVKRCSIPRQLGPDSQRENFEEAERNEGSLESTTLELRFPGGPSTREGGLDTCDFQDEAYYREPESDSKPRGAALETEGMAVELQVSFSGHSFDDGSGEGGSGVVAVTVISAERDSGQDKDSGSSKASVAKTLHSPLPIGEPLKLQNDQVTPSLGQVELTLQHPGQCREREEQEEEQVQRGMRGRVLSDPSEEGGSPACVSFAVSAEGAESLEEWDSESERDLGRPSKHRARHARLRRSESQSEKQVKEAKSKCKRIALLLTAAPNTTNKGVLMFKRRRQRAKKYTLVSYGTGETEPEDEEEDDEEEEDDQAVELTLLATSESELSEDLVNTQGCGDISGQNWDVTLQEIGKKVDRQEDMEHLPGTKGKGALMFAQRRQRIDEIAAEHEEMRKKGIPVEGVPAEAQYVPVAKYPQIEEHSYTQTSVTQPNQAFQNMNMHQLQQQQFQEQQQQPHIQTQQYPQAINGTVHLQANDSMRSLVANRSAKPFSGVQNRVPMPFFPSRSVTRPALPSYSEKFRVVPPPVPVNTRPQVWSPTGELIASRDERISVPAIKTGVLQDTRKRGTTKYASTSKVTPNAQFSMRADKGGVFESGPEEDYLSLGAEACNFMQTPTIRSKDPPPVAPKPTINPASPPWASRKKTQSPLHLPQRQSPRITPCLAVMQTQSPSLQQHSAASPWTPPQAHPLPPKNTWTPPQLQAHSQLPVHAWAAQPRAHSQSPMNTWTPQPQRAPMSTTAPDQTPAPHHQPAKSWNQPRVPAPFMVSRPINSYPRVTKTLPTVAVGEGSIAEGPERPAMRGKGAELFARRQARMEKFVVDDETVQANKVKPSSPTPSLPCSWKYSPNVRAPPPLSYNPILCPNYPPAAIKQPPPTSPKPKAKSMAQTPPPPKHLNTVEVMKHQPYQLDRSLFTYEATQDAKSISPKPAPTPDSSLTYSPSPVPTASPIPTFTLSRGVSKVQSPGPGLGRSYSLSLPRRLPSMTSRSDYGSPVTTPVFQASCGPLEGQGSWMEGYKPPSPWDAASRNPLGLVDEAFTNQTIQATIASNVKSAGQPKSLPEPPAEWKSRVSYEVASRGDIRPEESQALMSPTKSMPTNYGPPFRQYQPQRSVTETGTVYTGLSPYYSRPVSQPGSRPMYRVGWRRS